MIRFAKARLNVKHVKEIGTRKTQLNTKIEPNFKGSKKLNVVKVITLEPKRCKYLKTAL